jgi:TM2 domain-containing membrane protein YozV
MYKIIGADGRQYGPISAEQVKQWVAEGRANAQTMVQAEGSTEWKALANFPEFAAQIPHSAPPPISGSYSMGYDPRKSRLAAGLLGIFLGGFGVHRFYLGYTGMGIAQIVVTFVTCGIGSFWGLIEGILILCNTSITTDSEGRTLKD